MLSYTISIILEGIIIVFLNYPYYFGEWMFLPCITFSELYGVILMINFDYYKYSFLQFIMQRHFITKKEKRELILLYILKSL